MKKDGFDAMKEDAVAVSGWDFERIIPCHGVSLALTISSPCLNVFIKGRH